MSERVRVICPLNESDERTLADDVLDFEADPAETGKAIGNDLVEGKPTLPLIHVLRHGDAAGRQE